MCVCVFVCVHHAKTCRYSTPFGKASPKLPPYLPYTTNLVLSFSLALFVAPKRNGSGYRFALLSTIQVHYTISLYHQAYTAAYRIGTSHCHLPVRCLQNPYTYRVPGAATLPPDWRPPFSFLLLRPLGVCLFLLHSLSRGTASVFLCRV